MTALVWLQWGCPKIHAFIVKDGVQSERTLCNNYIGQGSTPVLADPVNGPRCAACDDVLRARGRQPPRLDVYYPRHRFEEWALQP